MQFDIKTAFLDGEVKEKIYMEQPKGFFNHEEEGKVCRLLKKSVWTEASFKTL
jgi:hypothetical protein